ncbi:S8 family serine peptidase [Micromonospora sp. NPDC049114]|uniref:S8 family serine peptidase n=1 Tax=unclassified Micromonospora TaxID=2617518 RepID=UPI0033FCDE84
MTYRTAAVGLVLASVTTLTSVLTTVPAMAEPGGAQLPSAPRTPADSPNDQADAVVPGRYIVVLKDTKATPAQTRAAATALSRNNGGAVRQVFTRTLRGYSAQLSATQAKRLAADEDVASVQPVRRYRASGTQTNPPSWGLDRIDQVTPALNKTYSYPSASASGVTAYVIDTGIKIDHQDFGTRASYGYDAVDDDTVAEDCEGHGTHVAGTLGGSTYGVAKDVKLVAVRVLDCSGKGDTETILAGIDWVTANAVKPAVANMSLGTVFGRDPAMEQAVATSIASGITYAVAAGNSYDDACNYSPSALPTAITVGATDRIDMRATFSNWGSCLDTFAPGVGITSAGIASPTASLVGDGTSMASPHVAGAAALRLAVSPTSTPAQVRDYIVTSGISGAVLGTTGSLDRLLYVGPAVTTRSDVGLRARTNDSLVTAESAGTKPLVARGAVLGAWEKFDLVAAGSGLVALKAKVNGKFVTAESAGTKPLIARGTAIGAWEKFQLLNNTDGSVSLKAQVNGKFVTAESAGTKPLIARGTTIGAWEKFDLESPNPVISLKASANGKFVTAENGGTKPLIARATAPGAWEKYELVDLGYQYYALRALVNNKYVAAGANPLLASGTAITDSTVFYVIDHNADGTVHFGAYVNDKAVTAESGGGKPLIANRNIDWSSPTYGLGPWEKFTIGLA